MLAEIPTTPSLMIVYNNSKDEAKNLWNHRRAELHRELQMHKQRAVKLYEEGTITSPSIAALFSENPDFGFEEDDGSVTTLKYNDIASYPTDVHDKDAEHLNPFWKQLSEHANLDELFKETEEIQTWTEEYRKPVPMFK